MFRDVAFWQFENNLGSKQCGLLTQTTERMQLKEGMENIVGLTKKKKNGYGLLLTDYNLLL